MFEKEDVLYSSRNLPLLTLKGQITIYFMDNQTLEGEFITQDEYSIFIRVNQDPVMISRDKIRYIQGRPGQQVTVDDSHVALLGISPKVSRDSENTASHAPDKHSTLSKSKQIQPDDAYETNLEGIKSAKSTVVLDEDDEEDDSTFVSKLEPAADLDSEADEDETFMLPPPPPFEEEDEEEEEKEDATFVLPSSLTIEEDDEEDEATFVLPSVTPDEDKEEDEDENDEENEATFILPTPSDKMSEPDFKLPPEDYQEDDDEDSTFFMTAPPDEDDDISEGNNQSKKALTAYMNCTSGPHAGELFELKSSINTIGRASTNAFALTNDKEISRNHATILEENGKFIIRDQNSLNGTFVNNELIEKPRVLEDGDVILIGVTTLVYHLK